MKISKEFISSLQKEKISFAYYFVLFALNYNREMLSDFTTIFGRNLTELDMQTMYRKGFIKYMKRVPEVTPLELLNDLENVQIAAKGEKLLLRIEEDHLVAEQVAVDWDLPLDTGKDVEAVVKPEREAISAWIEDYIDKFRKAVKKVGSTATPKKCTDNFIKFKDEYPEYFDKDLIFRATDLYIQQQKLDNGCAYLMRANYFIFKDGDSRLAVYCEHLINGGKHDLTHNDFSKYV